MGSRPVNGNPSTPAPAPRTRNPRGPQGQSSDNGGQIGPPSVYRPSPALIVALIALIVASAGVGVGASFITGKRIKNGSIRGVNIKNHSIGKAKLKGNFQGPRGTTGATGARGLQGLQGLRGPAGEAVAYARVAADGALEPGDGGKQEVKNIAASSIQHASAGVYCFGGLPFAVASAMVWPDSAGDITTNTIASVAIAAGGNHAGHVRRKPPAGPSLDGRGQQCRRANADRPRFQVWFEATGGSQIAPGPGGD